MIEQKSSPGQGRLSDLKEKQKKALLVGTYLNAKAKPECEQLLEELKSLGETYGLETAVIVPCPIRAIEAATFIGSGKVEEIKLLAEENGCSVVIFDDEISPQQQRNLEKILGRVVIDRTELILGVFAQRAKTKEARIQVELAALRYQMPRLKRLWTHLSRQRSGGASGGFVKGEGEKQIEIDRRILKREVEDLQVELKEVKKQREIQRRQRARSKIPTFAIIGYTNVGKSTLMRALTDADVFIEDKLFATLDTTTRKYTLPNRQSILLIDTVGFIRKIPHLLVAAFKSTLEEAVQADILLHLIDTSSPAAEMQAQATFDVLKELKALNRPIITVLNKVDQCQDKGRIQRLKIRYTKTVEISALQKTGFDALLEKMMKEISLLRKIVKLRIPQSDYAIVSEVRKEGRVISCEYEENDVLLEVEIPLQLEREVAPFLVREITD
ncbi:MAG: GTPase HflX [Chlamydiae bacterium RIFCSPHIGHO2_12_FULL_49_9]|nr:MAG: GTPase HflX [Chlamydiae bacterium RIFCSPHIGHO2_12_FULL_49_9]